MAKKAKEQALKKEEQQKTARPKKGEKAAQERGKKKGKEQAIAQEIEETLPQNILPVGERVLGDKKIYIAQKVYRQIHKFTEGKTENESGGILVGRFLEEFGKTNIMIEGFVEARHCEATPQTLTFTHETWEAVDQEIEKKHKGKSIVGWIHTHPDFGIFLSNYDTFIQENFFKEENQIAYVIDPIRGEEGFYFWVDGKIERCPGFYLYDKTGTPITALQKKEQEAPEEQPAKGGLLSGIQTALLVVLSAAVVLLGFQVISLKEQVSTIRQSFSQLVMEVQQSLSLVGQADVSLQNRIAALEEALGIPAPAPSASMPAASMPADPGPSAAPAASPEQSADAFFDGASAEVTPQPSPSRDREVENGS